MFESGSSTHHLLDDIIHYTLSTSIFDLVAISVCKFVLLIVLLTELETCIIARLYQLEARPAFYVLRYLFTALLFLVSLCSLAFAIVKFIFVLREMSLSRLYLSTVYLFLIFSSIESIGVVLMLPYLSRLKLLEQQRSAAEKKKVDLRRLFSLAKSERTLIGIGTVFLLLSSLTQIVQPYFFGKIIDDALNAKTMRPVNISVIILLAINLAGAFTSFFRSWVFELAGQ